MLIAVHDNLMYMFADKKADEISEEDKCVVYNKYTEALSPEMCVGCWTRRMGPWENPTEEQIKEVEKWDLKLGTIGQKK